MVMSHVSITKEVLFFQHEQTFDLFIVEYSITRSLPAYLSVQINVKLMQTDFQHICLIYRVPFHPIPIPRLTYFPTSHRHSYIKLAVQFHPTFISNLTISLISS